MPNAADHLFVGGRLTERIDLVSIVQALAVAEHLSFSGAARALGIRQSGVSKRVRRLEDILGIALFERHPRGVRTTIAGREFLERARTALDEMDHAFARARRGGRGETGVLRIGVFTSLAGGFLRELILEFSRSHPDVALDIQEGERRVHIAKVRAHSLDVAITTGNADLVGCETAELWREQVHVALPANHPFADRIELSWDEIKDERFIVSEFPPGPEVHDYIVRRTADYSHYPDVARLAVQHETLMSLVGMGFGLTLVSEGWTALTIPDVVMAPLASEADRAPFSAIWSPANDNPALRRFLTAAHALAGRVRPGTSDWANRIAASQ